VFTREGLPYMTFYLAGIGIVYILAVFVRGVQHIILSLSDVCLQSGCSAVADLLTLTSLVPAVL